MSWFKVVAFVAACLWLIGVTALADTAFVSTWNWGTPTALYRIDPSTQSAIPIVQTGSPGWDQGVCGPDGNLYFSDLGNLRIARVTKDGVHITTVAKLSGQPGDPDNMYSGPDGPSFDAQGNLYFTTGGFGGLWRLNSADPTKEPVQITAAFGPGHGNWGGAATAVLTKGPYAGDVIVSHHAGNVVYKISPNNCPSQGSTNCAQPKVFLQEESLGQTFGLAINSHGDIFVGSSSTTNDSNSVGRGWVSKFAPDGSFMGQFVDLGNTEADGIAFDSQDNLWAVTATAVFKITPSGQRTLVSGVPFEGVGIAICKDATTASADSASSQPRFPSELTALWLFLGLYAVVKRRVS